MNAQRFFTSPIGILISAAGATFLWEVLFPFIKLSYAMLDIERHEIFEQFLFAGYRFLLAALIIIGFTLLMKKSIGYQKGSLKPLSKIALFQTFFQYVFFYIGLSYSSGIQGSIIAGTTSFFQIILAHYMYKNDYISVRKIVGLIIGFIGVILVNVSKGTLQLEFGIGELFLLIAMFCGALGNIFAKNGAQQMDIFYMTSSQMLLGAIGLISIAVFKVGLFPFNFDINTLSMLLYLAVLSSAGFILWNSVMKYNKVGKISIYLFLIPVFGVLLSSLILREELHIFILVALSLVVSGIIIVNREPEKKLAKQTP